MNNDLKCKSEQHTSQKNNNIHLLLDLKRKTFLMTYTTGTSFFLTGTVFS